MSLRIMGVIHKMVSIYRILRLHVRLGLNSMKYYSFLKGCKRGLNN